MVCCRSWVGKSRRAAQDAISTARSVVQHVQIGYARLLAADTVVPLPPRHRWTSFPPSEHRGALAPLCRANRDPSGFVWNSAGRGGPLALCTSADDAIGRSDAERRGLRCCSCSSRVTMPSSAAWLPTGEAISISIQYALRQTPSMQCR
nr:hypothetical protein CFP56_08108 [Quercus suber]